MPNECNWVVKRFLGFEVRRAWTRWGVRGARWGVVSAALAGVLYARWWLLEPATGDELVGATAGATTPKVRLLPPASTAVPALADTRAASATPAVSASGGRSPSIPKGATTTLLVGIDRRPDGKGAGLADTILLAILDERAGTAGVISIPRDLWVTIPGQGEHRINVIPTLSRGKKTRALELFSRVIEDTLGLPISHGVFVDLGVFERVVDAVGGVEVMVPCAIVDSFHDDRSLGGRRKLDLPAGRALLDGPTAAMYVRSRHGRSDFGRSRRQQAVLLGLRDRVLSSDGILRVPELYSAVEAAVSTDLRRYEVLDLARRVLALDRGALHGLVLSPPLTVAHATSDGKAVLLPDREKIRSAIAALRKAGPPGEPLKVPCPPADAALRGAR